MKKRQRKKNKNIKRASRIVDKYFRKMSDTKFRKIMDLHMKDHEQRCQRETCEGECQGMGWCEDARRFREEEIPKIMKERSENGNLE